MLYVDKYKDKGDRKTVPHGLHSFIVLVLLLISFEYECNSDSACTRSGCMSRQRAVLKFTLRNMNCVDLADVESRLISD
jgi:hypothetical protein